MVRMMDGSQILIESGALRRLLGMSIRKPYLFRVLQSLDSEAIDFRAASEYFAEYR